MAARESEGGAPRGRPRRKLGLGVKQVTRGKEELGRPTGLRGEGEKEKRATG